MEQQQQKIRLYQSRDFSGIFDTSFTFIKQHYGAIIKGLLVFVPILLVSVYFFMNILHMSTIGGLDSMGRYDDPFRIFAEIFDWRFFLGLFLIMIASYLMTLYPVCYMALFAGSKDGTVDSKAVWDKMKQVVFPLLGYSIVYSILIAAGSLLCLIPGIIAGIYFCLYLYVYIIEGKGLVETFQRSINLVRHHWWITLGMLIVFSFIISAITFVFTLPVYGTLIGVILDIDFLKSELYIYLAYSLNYIVRFLLNPAISIVLGIMYFSYRSQLDGMDMVDEIDLIGAGKENEDKWY
jgi:hypothetical protein